MKCYKVTDRNTTSNGMKWGPEVSNTATGKGTVLCTDGFIHFYRNPILAALMRYRHVPLFSRPTLWESEYSGKVVHEPLKSGSKTLKTVKKIPFPKITKNQRIAIGILCVKKYSSKNSPKFVNWANNWLSGKDRTKLSAQNISRNSPTNNPQRHILMAVYSKDIYLEAIANSISLSGVTFDDFKKIINKGMKIK